MPSRGHTQEEWQAAKGLLAQGFSAQRTAKILGIPRSTVGYWHRGGHASDLPSGDQRYQGHDSEDQCPWLPVADPRAYAYLLGVYLGDGHVANAGGHGTKRLLIALDDRHPDIQAQCLDAVAAVSHKPANLVRSGNYSRVSSYSLHWLCVFPQHGPGRKHDRRILLADWQQKIANAHPGLILRGLIHSDGCRDLNRVSGREYPRYSFHNRSGDIHSIFRDAATQLGVRYTVRETKTGTVTTIARRPDVAVLDQWIGPKS